MKLHTLVITCLFSLSFSASAALLDDDKLALKAGFGFHSSFLKNNMDQRKSLPGVVLAPQVSHRLGQYFELGVLGLLRFGKSQHLSFEVDQKTLDGNVRAYDVLVSPQLRAYLPIELFRSKWPVYITAGPSWSLHTFAFKDNPSARLAGFNLTSDQFKLAYDTHGWIVGIGVQELTTYKEMHPVFIEILYAQSTTRKVTVLDTSKFHKTNEVFDQTDRRYRSQSIILQMGLTLF